MTVLSIRHHSIAYCSCGIELYFVANTTGLSLPSVSAAATALRQQRQYAACLLSSCRLPIVVAASNRTRHRLIAYRHRGIKLYSFTNQEDQQSFK
mmetsp:Transcript_10253/g.11733  ORF Transcript_10253/g.11733 Transcript_10253/m.11733 type:complete len:95 (+) Transcript_10253:335-619(+)